MWDQAVVIQAYGVCMVILNLRVSLVFWFSASWLLFAVVSMMKWPWSAFDLNFVWYLFVCFLNVSNCVKLKILFRTRILVWHKLLIHEVILVVSFCWRSDHVNWLFQLNPDFSALWLIAWECWSEVWFSWFDHSLNMMVFCLLFITFHTLKLTAYSQLFR